MRSRKSSVLGLALLALGCVTVPPTRSPEEWWGLLPPGSVLVWGRIQPLRAILESALAEERDVKTVLDRAKEFYGAADPLERRLSLALLGDFPRGLGSLGLDWNQNWSREPGPVVQWVHRRRPLAVQLPMDGVVLIHDRPQQEAPVQRTVALTPGALQTLNQGDLFLFVERPSRFVLQEVGDRIPIKSLSMSLILESGHPGSEAWKGDLMVEMENEGQARLMVTLLRLFRRPVEQQLTELGLGVDPANLRIEAQGERLLYGPLTIPVRPVFDLLLGQLSVDGG